LMQQMKERFDAEGISIPYPQQDVHMRQVPASPAQQPAAKEEPEPKRKPEPALAGGSAPGFGRHDEGHDGGDGEGDGER
ncbi:MAG: hypothetical protein AAF968_24765, partial [Pseudomonadota bacterium]